MTGLLRGAGAAGRMTNEGLAHDESIWAPRGEGEEKYPAGPAGRGFGGSRNVDPGIEPLAPQGPNIHPRLSPGQRGSPHWPDQVAPTNPAENFSYYQPASERRTTGMLAAKPDMSSFLATPEPPRGMVGLGNIDIFNRPSVPTPDGKTASVRSISIEIDGKEILIPTVSDDGRIMADDEAVEMFKKTGRHLGIFDSVEAADAYGELLHQQQESLTSE